MPSTALARMTTARSTFDWRTAYDRGPAQKPGHITRGSGTSVTLVGDAEGLVGDHGQCRTQDPRSFCAANRWRRGLQHPGVCTLGMSGTDVEHRRVRAAADDGGRTGSTRVLVENNWGNHSFPWLPPGAGFDTGRRRTASQMAAIAARRFGPARRRALASSSCPWATVWPICTGAAKVRRSPDGT